MATATEHRRRRRRRRGVDGPCSRPGPGLGRAPGLGLVLAAACAGALLLGARGALAHGRLIEPPSRASMWRYGFDSPPDYNDHQLYCGGFARQWSRNGGRCGVCGDAFDLPEPRPHEAGGVYGQGPVVRRWRAGSAVPLRVELTANHGGYFEFRLCPRDRPLPEATQRCLDAHPLRRAVAPAPTPAAPAPTRFYPEPGVARVFEMRYALPPGLVCRRCVLQWRYVAGNSWGRCENGTESVGCGPQEEFRACADVAIEGAKGEGEGEDEDVGQTTGAATTPAALPTPPPTADEQRRGAWWAALVLALATAVAAATALLLLYAYYYHAADIKAWLRPLRPRRPARADPAA